jgi:arabinoxylan arabinofuranohydrolase
VEEFKFEPDGSIEKVAYTTNGVTQIGHLNPYVRVEGETFNAQSGVETEPAAGGGMTLTDLHNGDWVRVVGVDFGDREAKEFSARVAAAGEGGSIEIRLGGLDGKLISTCKVENTGGFQKWNTVKGEASGASGVQDLYLRFTGGEGPLFNLDYWQFE